MLSSLSVRHQRLFLVTTKTGREESRRRVYAGRSHLALSARFRSPPPEAGAEMLQVACLDLTVTSSGRARLRSRSLRHADQPHRAALRRLGSRRSGIRRVWAVVTTLG